MNDLIVARFSGKNFLVIWTLTTIFQEFTAKGGKRKADMFFKVLQKMQQREQPKEIIRRKRLTKHMLTTLFECNSVKILMVNIL